MAEVGEKCNFPPGAGDEQVSLVGEQVSLGDEQVFILNKNNLSMGLQKKYFSMGLQLYLNGKQ